MMICSIVFAGGNFEVWIDNDKQSLTSSVVKVTGWQIDNNNDNADEKVEFVGKDRRQGRSKDAAIGTIEPDSGPQWWGGWSGEFGQQQQQLR